jgi:hypothetical protein
MNFAHNFLTKKRWGSIEIPGNVIGSWLKICICDEVVCLTAFLISQWIWPETKFMLAAVFASVKLHVRSVGRWSCGRLGGQGGRSLNTDVFVASRAVLKVDSQTYGHLACETWNFATLSSAASGKNLVPVMRSQTWECPPGRGAHRNSEDWLDWSWTSGDWLLAWTVVASSWLWAIAGFAR